MDTALSWILEHYPFIGFCLVLCGICIFITIKIHKIYSDAKHKLSEHDKLIVSLNERMLKADEKFNELQVMIAEELAQIKTFLGAKYPNSISMFGKKHSPMQLNEYGVEQYNRFEGESFLKGNYVMFEEMIDAKNPKTALDVEVASNEVLLESLSNDIFNGLKVWVYNAPSIKIKEGEVEREYTLTMRDICFILSIPLRDLYLEKHQNILK